MNSTLVLIKPDAVANNVWLEIIEFYQSVLAIGKVLIFKPLPIEIVIKLYEEHEGKEFYSELIMFMSQGITIALEIKGHDGLEHGVVEYVRQLNGSTNPAKAAKGTLR